MHQMEKTGVAGVVPGIEAWPGQGGRPLQVCHQCWELSWVSVGLVTAGAVLKLEKAVGLATMGAAGAVGPMAAGAAASGYG